MKKYVVRVEVLKTSLQYIDIDVEAKDDVDATKEAIKVYDAGIVKSALVDSGRVEYELDTGDVDNWKVEKVWEPKEGDFIEVSRDGVKWFQREFITSTKCGFFLCWLGSANQSSAISWEYAKEIKR